MWLLTLRSILLATDLEEGSNPALRTAATLAPLAGAELHVLHVTGAPDLGAPARVREHLDRAIPEAAAPASIQAEAGDPASVIVTHAMRTGAAAIILGPHRHAGGAGLFGSTAGAVIRAAPCPCLVAATELRLPLERVLVPVDLSQVADGTLSVALSWASALRPRERKATLTALHLSTPSGPEHAGRAMHDAVERARTRAGGAAHVEIRERIDTAPEAAEGILASAAAESADLLVMGTRGAAGAPSGLGSVSVAVARATPCPLLLVPPVVWEEQGADRVRH